MSLCQYKELRGVTMADLYWLLQINVDFFFQIGGFRISNFQHGPGFDSLPLNIIFLFNTKL